MLYTNIGKPFNFEKYSDSSVDVNSTAQSTNLSKLCTQNIFNMGYELHIITVSTFQAHLT